MIGTAPSGSVSLPDIRPIFIFKFLFIIKDSVRITLVQVLTESVEDAAMTSVKKWA